MKIRRTLARFSLIAGLALLTLPVLAGGKTRKTLWQIGTTDRNTAEFALAPKDHRQLASDGFFIIGLSDPSKDWPYVQPGPGDSWAGARQHTYTIAFGLKEPGKADSCSLIIDLADTQNSIPPKLEISINGLIFKREMPEGGGDESINGEPSKGKPFQIRIGFPASALKTDNEIKITSTSGSWILYDAIRLEGPDYMKLQQAESFLAISEIFFTS